MPTAQIEVVTPEMAAQLLEGNTRNRHISRARVNAMARKIAAGGWKMTGQTHIIVGSDGVLLNGQHTLSAIVESGCPVTTVVARDIDPSAFDAIDTGMKRTAAQVMAMGGESNAAALSAAIRMVITIENMTHTPNGWTFPKHADFGNEDIVETFRQDPVGWQWAAGVAVAETSHAVRTGLRLQPGPLGAFLFRAQAAGNDLDVLEEYVADVRSDEGHFDGNPATTVRRRLMAMSNRNRNSLAPRVDVCATWTKGWNARAEGRTLDQIRTWGRKSNAFPDPLLLTQAGSEAPLARAV